MQWLLLFLLSVFLGFVLGYSFRSSQNEADAYVRERKFFDKVMKEVENRTPAEATRIGEIIAKRMADDILKKGW